MQSGSDEQLARAIFTQNDTKKLGWKLTSPKFTGGNLRGPRCFDRPALLVPRKPAGQITVISNLDGDALNGRF